MKIEIDKNVVKQDSIIISFDIDDHYIYTGTLDSIVHIWDRETGEHVHKIDAHFGPVTVIHENNDFLFIGYKDLAINVHRKGAWKIHRNFFLHTKGISAIGTDGGHLYSAAQDGTMAKTDYETMKYKVFKSSIYWETSIAFDEKHFYTGSFDKVVRVWDKDSLKEKKTLVAHTKAISAVLVDDKYIYSGARDNKIVVWDKNTYEQVAQIDKHSHWVNTLALYENKLISGSWDNTLRVWEIDSWNQVLKLEFPESVNHIKIIGNEIYATVYNVVIKLNIK